MTIKDKDGDPFDRAATYGLTVTANVPVTLYWSLTAYDACHPHPIRGMPWASRSSNTPGLQVNSDGSVDLYFGPHRRHVGLAGPGAGRVSRWRCPRTRRS